MNNIKLSNKMRAIHRYLGFFLAGIMAVYAISGITLIYRDSDTFKKTYSFDTVIDKDLAPKQLGEILDIRRLKVESQKDGIIVFKEGTYNSNTGAAKYEIKKVPFVIGKLQHLHKAKTSDPLYYLNIFFGLSLLFFVTSAFFMFMPSSKMMKKGLYFTAGGILLTLILLFI